MPLPFHPTFLSANPSLVPTRERVKHVDIDYGDDGLVFAGFDADADEFLDNLSGEDYGEEEFDAFAPDIFA